MKILWTCKLVGITKAALLKGVFKWRGIDTAVVHDDSAASFTAQRNLESTKYELIFVVLGKLYKSNLLRTTRIATSVSFRGGSSGLIYIPQRQRDTTTVTESSWSSPKRGDYAPRGLCQKR